MVKACALRYSNPSTISACIVAAHQTIKRFTKNMLADTDPQNFVEPLLSSMATQQSPVVVRMYPVAYLDAF